MAILFGLLMLGLVLWAVRREPRSASRPPEPTAIGGTTMGGNWSVKFRSALPSPQRVQDDVQSLLDRLEGQMSLWRADSVLSRFNASQSTDWISVPTELAEVVGVAQGVSEKSGGAFDITVAPLVNLWGFGPARKDHRPAVPTDADVLVAREHVGYRKLQVRVDPPAIRKVDPLVAIDLGGIGKGFAADQVAHMLDALGVDYLVAIGGELRARGAWRVGIETPTPDTRRVFRSLVLRDGSLSTSGDYRNFREIEGKHYCHEIDPRTGRPIENSPASVSVIHPSGTEADALATAMMVLGPARGVELANRQGISALFILRGQRDFQVVASEAMQRQAH